jgi:hypothetical protein
MNNLSKLIQQPTKITTIWLWKETALPSKIPNIID